MADLPRMVDDGLDISDTTADETARARLALQVDTSPTTPDPATAPPALLDSANVTVEPLPALGTTAASG